MRPPSDIPDVQTADYLALKDRAHSPDEPYRNNSEPLKEVGQNGSANPQINTTSGPAPGPQMPVPPDGGLIAWLQVLGCFFCWFNSWYESMLAYDTR